MMEYGEGIITFMELAAKLLKAGCKVVGLLIGLAVLVFILWEVIKALKEEANE